MQSLRRFLLSGEGWPYLLVPFIPIAIALELAHAEATVIFACSAAGVIPTAALMGQATEQLAMRSGPGIGGFLNVTFGNAPEIIIALFALHEGLQEVVKASLVGSILGNILLVMGAAMLIGGRKRERQKFDRTAAGVQSLMLHAGGRRAGDAGDLPARGRRRPAGARGEGGQLRRRHRAPLDRRLDRPAHHLLRRSLLLAQDAQGPLQSRARGRRARGRAVVGAQGRR